MLVPSAAVVKQFVQTSLHKLLARVGAALDDVMCVITRAVTFRSLCSCKYSFKYAVYALKYAFYAPQYAIILKMFFLVFFVSFHPY